MPVDAGAVTLNIRADTGQLQDGARRVARNVENMGRATARFERTVNRARNSVRSFSRSIFNLRNAVGLLAGTTGLGALVRSTSRLGATMVESAANVGTTAQNLVLLQRVLEADGVSAEQTVTIFTRLNRSIGEAGDGLETYARQFRKAGVAIRDENGGLRDTFDVFRDLIEGTQNLSNEARTTILAGVGGRQGSRVGIVAQRGLEAFDAESDRQRALGLPSDAELLRLKELEQSYTDLGNAFETLRISVVSGFTSDLIDLVVALGQELTEAGADWQLHGYGGTMHAFTNPHANDPGFGTVYSESADRRSWVAMQNFFEETLGGG